MQRIRPLAGPAEGPQEAPLHHVEGTRREVTGTDGGFDVAILFRLPDVVGDLAGPAVDFLAALDAADPQVPRTELDVDVAARRHVDGEVNPALHSGRRDHRGRSLDLRLRLHPRRLLRTVDVPCDADLLIAAAGDVVVAGRELHRDFAAGRERLVHGNAIGRLDWKRGGKKGDGDYGERRCLHATPIRRTARRSFPYTAIASTWRRTLARSVRSCARRDSVSRSFSPSARTKRL